MKLSVDFPSVAYREGPQKVIDLGQGIEEIGYDEIAVFDHVVMGFGTDTREPPRYPAEMPILEAIVLLSQLAAVTERIGLSTEVLVLPQRQPVLVAKQISTIDLLSQGRVRLGVGVGWHEAEYDALEADFSNRGRRMDEAIALLRAYWSDQRIDFQGEYYTSTAMALEPKPAQVGGPPIWVGGGSRAALRRAGQMGDGWMGSAMVDDDRIRGAIDTIRLEAERAARDPAGIGLQMMLQPPPSRPGDADWYRHHDRVVERVEALAGLGFEWVSLNATAIFQAGARSVDAMLDQLAQLHEKITAAVG